MSGPDTSTVLLILLPYETYYFNFSMKIIIAKRTDRQDPYKNEYFVTLVCLDGFKHGIRNSTVIVSRRSPFGGGTRKNRCLGESVLGGKNLRPLLASAKRKSWGKPSKRLPPQPRNVRRHQATPFPFPHENDPRSGLPVGIIISASFL